MQALFRQSATRPREVPSSGGRLSFSARGLLRNGTKVAGSTVDANLEFKVRFWFRTSLLSVTRGSLTEAYRRMYVNDLSEANLSGKATDVGPLRSQDVNLACIWPL